MPRLRYPSTGEGFAVDAVEETMKVIHQGHIEGSMQFKIPTLSDERKNELCEYYSELLDAVHEPNEKEIQMKNEKERMRQLAKQKNKKPGFFSKLLGNNRTKKMAATARKNATDSFPEAKGTYQCRLKWAKYITTPPERVPGPPENEAENQEKKEKKRKGEESRSKETNTDGEERYHRLSMGCYLCSRILGYRGNFEAPHILMSVCALHRALFLLPADSSPTPNLVPNCRTATKALLSKEDMNWDIMAMEHSWEGQLAYGTLCDPNWFGEFFGGMRLGAILSRIHTWSENDLNDYIYEEQQGRFW